jgi:predicted nucleic acid-binding protein
MILVDTSVWIAFFRGEPRSAALSRFLEEDAVLVHPWVEGELMLGNLGPKRNEILRDLARLPAAPLLGCDETKRLIEARKLRGTGVGWVDAQLLGSALAAEAFLWTFDKKLARIATQPKRSDGDA